MKLKSFVMLAMVGLIAAPLVYITPAMAEEDTEQGDQAMQMLSDSGMPPQSLDPMSTNDDKDSGTPDTATGDDDY